MTLAELVGLLGAARLLAGRPGATVDRFVVATDAAAAPSGVAVVEEPPTSPPAGRPLVWADAGIDAAAAELAGLADAEPLVRFPLDRRKLVAFVPEEAVDVVRDAVFAAGAGRIGAYERCSFLAAGTGTFRPLPGAQPAVGAVGAEERAAEVRVETVYPADAEADVVRALLRAHPYEEPAFDLVPLANVAARHGRGRVGTLAGGPAAVWLGESASAEGAAVTLGAERVHLPADLEREALALAAGRLAERTGLVVDAPGAAGPANAGEAPDRVVLRVDGGSRGNPGPAAIGYVIEGDGGAPLVERGEPIGHATNNVAEYRALVAGLEAAAALGAREVEVRADSELLVKQMTGAYRVKNPGLRPLWDAAQRAADRFTRVRYRAVPRAQNAVADRLVNEALDRL